MKTRTLLLLSVGIALAILLAGGVFLFRLSNETQAVEPAAIGEQVEVGDVAVVLTGTSERAGVLTVDLEVGGVDDADGIDSFRLVTGDRRLEPIATVADGRCGAIAEQIETCSIAFDVSAVESSSRVLVLRRGDEQRNWVVAAP